jgi:hypothetical protein
MLHCPFCFDLVLQIQINGQGENYQFDDSTLKTEDHFIFISSFDMGMLALTANTALSTSHALVKIRRI